TLPRLDPDQINDPSLREPVGPESKGAAVVRAEILLDRVKFSPGQIEVSYHANLKRAVAAFQKERGVAATGTVDAKTWEFLNGEQLMLVEAKLDQLNYGSALEGIAAKFHISPRLLEQLNPGKDFEKVGEQVVVPNVLTPAPSRAASVVVDGSDHSVSVLDSQG